jgi:hypothetical protein
MHTDGPWMAASKPSSVVGWPVVSQTGRSIASVTYVNHPAATEEYAAFNAESLANARLIAAAPDLLSALNDLRLVLKLASIKFGFDLTDSAAMAKANSAISLATGGADVE